MRKADGRFLCDPNSVYLRMRAQLQMHQVPIKELFWCEDEDMFLGFEASLPCWLLPTLPSLHIVDMFWGDPGGFARRKVRCLLLQQVLAFCGCCMVLPTFHFYDCWRQSKLEQVALQVAGRKKALHDIEQTSGFIWEPWPPHMEVKGFAKTGLQNTFTMLGNKKIHGSWVH